MRDPGTIRKRAAVFAAFAVAGLLAILLSVSGTAASAPNEDPGFGDLDFAEQELSDAGGHIEPLWQIEAPQGGMILLQDADEKHVLYETRVGEERAPRYFWRRGEAETEILFRTEEGYRIQQMKLFGESVAFLAVRPSEQVLETDYYVGIWRRQGGNVSVKQILFGRVSSVYAIPTLETFRDRLLLFGTGEVERDTGARFERKTKENSSPHKSFLCYLAAFDQDGKECAREEEFREDDGQTRNQWVMHLPRRSAATVTRLVFSPVEETASMTLWIYNRSKDAVFRRKYNRGDRFVSVTPLGNAFCLRARAGERAEEEKTEADGGEPEKLVYDLCRLENAVPEYVLGDVFKGCELLAAEPFGTSKEYFVFYRNRLRAQMYGYLSLEEEKPERKLFLGEHEPAHIQSDLVQPRFFRDAAGHLMMAGTRIDRPCIEAYRLSLPTP